jgi:hypothetical protein
METKFPAFDHADSSSTEASAFAISTPLMEPLAQLPLKIAFYRSALRLAFLMPSSIGDCAVP